MWVVADQRQSIYRFRGAEPSNVSRFEGEFGGTRHSLRHNYRSFAAVVRTFERFSQSMGSNGGMAGSWVANRADGGHVSLTVTPSLTAEAQAIRDKIEELHALGVPYREQVILARSHLTLARITGILESLGVPLLYLGDLFERGEIRDLLSLVAIDAEFGGVGLVRVAALPEYAVSQEESVAALRYVESKHISIFNALKRTSEIEGLSETARAGLAKLGVELDGLGVGTSPWTLLTTWPFERSDYLSPLLKANDAVSRQKLIAIYQLLKVCGEQVAMGDSSRSRFLDRVRRIEALNEDTIYRAVASEATDMDAVRVMTIHGSKGLEFRAVHLPVLATSYMPAKWRGVRCLPPQSLARVAMRPDYHQAEEECLFFVALSRARDYLCLSRAERYTTVNATASKFLSSITPLLRPYRFNGSHFVPSTESRLNPPGPRDRYEECASLRSICNAHCDTATKRSMASAECGIVRPTSLSIDVSVRPLDGSKKRGRADVPLTRPRHVRLAAEWQVRGPVGHGFEDYYRDTAERMVAVMANAIATERGNYDQKEWAVPVNSRHVLLTPDRLLCDPAGVVHVQRIRTGRMSKSEPDHPIYALLRRGAAAYHPWRGSPSRRFIWLLAKLCRFWRRTTASSSSSTPKRLPASSAGIFQQIPRMRVAVPIANATSCAECKAVNASGFFCVASLLLSSGSSPQQGEERCRRQLFLFRFRDKPAFWKPKLLRRLRMAIFTIPWPPSASRSMRKPSSSSVKPKSTYRGNARNPFRA